MARRTSKKTGLGPKIVNGLRVFLDSIFFLRIGNADEVSAGSNGPSWRFRRKLIYGGYRTGFAMIVFGGFTYMNDMYSVGSGMVAGGVSLISIILTAYTATATYEDVKIWQSNNNNEGEQ